MSARLFNQFTHQEIIQQTDVFRSRRAEIIVDSATTFKGPLASPPCIMRLLFLDQYN